MKAWTQSDTDMLRRLVSKEYSDADIGGVLERSEKQVRDKRHTLQLRTQVPGKLRTKWTDEMDAEIASLRADGHSLAEIAEAVDRTRESVRRRLKRIGSKPLTQPRPWTQEEDARVREHTGPISVLANELGRTKCAVVWRRKHIGVSAIHPHWTANDYRILADMIDAQRPRASIAKSLGRTVAAVRTKISKLG